MFKEDDDTNTNTTNYNDHSIIFIEDTYFTRKFFPGKGPCVIRVIPSVI